MVKGKKRGLGKGLEALIPDMISFNEIEQDVTTEKIEQISIHKIYPNPNQPRKSFNEESIQELANSIKIHGIIQPLIVSKTAKGYMIIAGERRLRASRLIDLKEVSCIVKNYSEKQLLEVSLIENLQRQDLNVIEEALAYQYLIQQYKVTQEELSEALGKSRSYLANILRLLRLDQRVIDFIIEGKLSGGHGRAILSIEPLDRQYLLAEKIISEGLSVRQVEELVKNLNNAIKENHKKTKNENKDIHVAAIEESLRSIFGTKVNIIKGNKKGKIEIEYYNDEDLDRIIGLLQ